MTTEETLYEKLSSAGPRLQAEAVEAINRFTRHKMHALSHIPLRYYLLPACGNEEKAAKDFKELSLELSQRGVIALDEDGEPCCLSGKKPVLSAEELGVANDRRG